MVSSVKTLSSGATLICVTQKRGINRRLPFRERREALKTSAYLSSVTATVASVLHMPAFAQDIAQGSAPPAAEQTAPGVTGVEDILVTATKRKDNLIEVPISMSVMKETANNSAGIDSASEYLSKLPNDT